MVRWVLSLFLAAGPAVAMVDSPQLEEVTCQGPCPDGQAGRSRAGATGVAAAGMLAVLVFGLVAGGRWLRVPRRPGNG